MQTYGRPLSVVRASSLPRIRPAGQGLTVTQGAFALIAASMAFAFGAAYVGAQLQRARA